MGDATDAVALAIAERELARGGGRYTIEHIADKAALLIRRLEDAKKKEKRNE